MRGILLSAWIGLILSCCVGGRSLAQDQAPWHLRQIDRLAEARPGPSAASAAQGPQRYLHLRIDFRVPSEQRRKHVFRVVDRQGEPIGELWGWNEEKSTLVFDGRWNSLAGLYLEGLGHREPLSLPSPNVQPAPAQPEKPMLSHPAPVQRTVLPPFEVPRSEPITIDQRDPVVVKQPEPIVVSEPNRVIVHGGGNEFHVRTGPDVIVHDPRPARVFVHDGDNVRTIERSGDRVILYDGTRIVVQEGGQDLVLNNSGERIVVDPRDGTLHVYRDGSKAFAAGVTSPSVSRPGSQAGSGRVGQSRAGTAIRATASSVSGPSGSGIGAGSGGGMGSGGSAGGGTMGETAVGVSGMAGGGGGVAVQGNFGVASTYPPGPKQAVYISCGEEGRPGRVYQVDEQGTVLGIVPLAQAATGVALHRGNALVLAVPGDGGRLQRIDSNGKLSTLLTDHKELVHPVDVGIAANSDTILVADNIADVLATTDTAGREPRIIQRLHDQKWTVQGMSVAMTGDRYVLFGTDGRDGIYRFTDGDTSTAQPAVLPYFGGVAADTGSPRWAAAQGPNMVYVYQGEELIRKYRMPPGKELYRNGVLAFAPGGDLVIVARSSGESGGETWLHQYGSQRPGDGPLFRWAKEPILDIAVGPRMPWDSPTPRNSKSIY